MLSKKIILLADKNKDSKIHIEKYNNEDKIRFITEGQQRMIISNSTTSGNIGIGLNFNNPTSTLDIQGELAVSKELNIGKNLTVSGNGIFNDKINVGELLVSNKIGIGTSTVETSLDVDSSLKVFDVLNNVSGYVNTSDGNYMKLQATSRTDTSTKKNIVLNSDGGNIGIGNNSPNYLLDVLYNVPDNNTYSSYPPTSNTPAVFSIGTTSAIFQTTAGGGKHGVAIGGDVVTGNGFIQSVYNNIFGFNLCLQPNGDNVGIGITTPSYPLHVVGVAGNMPSMRYFNSSSPNLQSGANDGITIYAGGNIYASSLIAASDSRIKTNIEELVDNEALLKFRQLKPCKYNYIDTITRTSDEVYGFIAQEVKTILPYASSILSSNEYIPNIYKLALYNNNIIIFDTVHNLDSNGNIKLIKTNNKEIICPFTVVDTLKINIDTSNLSDDEKPSNDLIQGDDGNNLQHNIFVYGTEVDDFHTLNKDAIWTTATAALQEVDRIQQADAVKIQTLENKVSTLETELEAEKTKVSTLETQLADLLARVSALENN